MAQPPINLREDLYKGSKPGKYFQRGRFLSIDEIENDFQKKEIAQNYRSPTESLTMLRNITGRREDPFMQTMARCRARLTVSRLQHVTGRKGFDGITLEQRFTGKPKNISDTDQTEFKCFSWWGVVVSSDETTSLKEIAYKDFKENNPQVLQQIAMETIKKQFANSPVFEEGSRYGNFKFSLPVEDLLAAYKVQYCPPYGTLVFRVLGTWTYQQEILHSVLIHGSQFNNIFSDLPEITANIEDPIYRLPDGTFKCNLESSSIGFTLRVGLEEIEDLGDYHDPCVWNNPTFAFFLPKEDGLEIAISEENLEPCEIVQPYMPSRGEPIPVPEATRLIQAFFTKQRQRRGN